MLEILIFSIISIFFVIPPLFVDGQFVQSIDFSTFSFINFYHFIIAIFLVYFYKNSFENFSLNTKYILKNFFGLIISFLIILLVSKLLNYIAFQFFDNENSIISNSVFVNKPESFAEYFVSILNLIFASFFEETIYRFYLPVFLIRLFVNKFSNPKLKTILFLILESFVLLIFAFSHRYLGSFSVINAGIAHLIFRITFIYTKNIYTTSIAHFIYNFYSLICY